MKLQAVILQRFWRRWRHKYLTSLRKYHRSSEDNKQTTKRGDVVLVHDDGPRPSWRLAVVEDLIKGGDDLIRAAKIRTSTGHTNRPICKLYPLELSASESTSKETSDRQEQSDVDRSGGKEESAREKPKKAAATRATSRISEWTKTLRRPPPPSEDVEETN